MPKISDIEETPNPNAVKFILREAVSNGTAHQYGSPESNGANSFGAKQCFLMAVEIFREPARASWVHLQKRTTADLPPEQAEQKTGPRVRLASLFCSRR